MLVTTALVAAPVVFAAGAFIFWANPTRRVNQMVFFGTVQTAAWLVCWHFAATSPRGQGLLWLRWTSAAGALAPLSFWLVKESILLRLERLEWRWFCRNIGWLIVPLIVAMLPFTDAFIPNYSTDEQRIRGWGYYAYMGSEIMLYGLLLYNAIKSSWTLSGGQRLELQVWLGGGCSMFITVWTLSALSTWTGEPTFRRLMPVAVLVFYAGTAIAITVHRIFDARQILLIVLEKALLLALVAGAAYLTYVGLSELFTSSIVFLATVTVGLWLTITVNGVLNRFFQFYPQATSARQAIFSASRSELQIGRLEQAFSSILHGWGHAEQALILFGSKGLLSGGGKEIAADHPAIGALRQLRWATPERLLRERTTPERAALARFLDENGLGAVVIGEGSSLTAVVGVGVPVSRRPYTYPQITQLLEFTSIIEAALERAHFSVKAQHAEQLATVGLLGASMAHEIRNPLVTIKTFVQLLPKHYQDQVFRDKFFTLIGDEVTRIDRLTEQLLDLASPRVYNAKDIELHPVLRSSVELVAAKATDKRIRFLTEFNAAPDRVMTDASAAKQVLLNLCFNAIQAVENIDGERWVKVSTRNVNAWVEMSVEDSGPGIAPAIRPHLFEPFQSTKSSGFGLGLAICSDILAGLDATISVDPSEPGRGATFRILFPCPA